MSITINQSINQSLSSPDSEKPPLAVEIIEFNGWEDHFDNAGSPASDTVPNEIEEFLKVTKRACKKVCKSLGIETAVLKTACSLQGGHLHHTVYMFD